MTTPGPDPSRPLVHFTAPQNWLNDPNGIIWWKDTYHLFYQHNPAAPVWGRPHWGHATSTDLLRWSHRPIALRPDHRLDTDGCYSGCCVDDSGTATILYTGVRDERGVLHERVLLATSTDGLLTWQKRAEPVIDRAPESFVGGFRDPFVWREPDGSWRMLLGSGTASGGAVLCYSSPDLRVWRYLGVFLDQQQLGDDPLTAGSMWECPQLVRSEDGAALLLLSVWDGAPLHVAAVSGALDGDQLKPERVWRFDGGSSYYAPHVFTLPDGRTAAYGWLREDPRDVPDSWSGVLSLPRQLTAGDSGAWHQAPLHELERLRLRSRPTEWVSGPVTVAHIALTTVTPPFELVFTVQLPERSTLELALYPAAEDIGPLLRLCCSVDSATVSVADHAHADADHAGTDPRAPLIGLTVRLVADGPVVEAFVNGQTAAAGRLFPRDAAIDRVTLAAGGQLFQVDDLDVFELGLEQHQSDGDET